MHLSLSVAAGCSVPGAVGEERPLTRPISGPPEDQKSVLPLFTLLLCLAPTGSPGIP